MATAKQSILLTFRAATDADYDWLFQLKSSAERAYVEPIFGWHKPTQESLFAQEWQRTRPVIIYCQQQRIGSYCIEQDNGKTFFRRFVIVENYRGQGIGRCVIEHVLTELTRQRRNCHVAVFHGNPVVSLYQALGFKNYKTTEHFIYFHYCPIV